MQIVTNILPNPKSSSQSGNEIKAAVMLSLGEAGGEVVWAAAETKRLLSDLARVQKELDGTTGSEFRSQLSKAADAAATRVLELQKKNPKDWEFAMPEGVPNDFSVEAKSKLASKISEVLTRALHRRLMLRIDIYDRFFDFYTDRGRRFVSETLTPFFIRVHADNY